MDKMRDEFDAWFKKDFHPDKSGPYLKDMLREAWQASRESLVVELPITPANMISTISINKIINAIQAAGIKVVSK